MRRMHSAVIVGAGCFGASLAWWLARDGREVTLVDQFEPGDPRATSGGESRLIRCGHGPDAGYTASARRARTLWRELEAECGEELLIECGLDLVRAPRGRLGGAGDRDVRGAGHPVRAARARGRRAAVPELRARRPRVPAARARGGRAARPARGARAGAPGGRARRRAGARHGAARTGRPRGCEDGRVLEADVVVWACGAWLGAAVPASTSRSAATRQELFFFDGGPGVGAPPACPRSSTSTARSTARATSTGSASRPRRTSTARRSTPDAELPPATRGGRGARARASSPSASPRSRTRRSRGSKSLPLRALARRALHRRAASPSTRPCGCSAAAPATASSTGRRWPSASPPPARRRAAAGAVRARRRATRRAACSGPRGATALAEQAGQRAGVRDQRVAQASGCAAPPPGCSHGTSRRPSRSTSSSPWTSVILRPGAKCASAWRPSGIDDARPDQRELLLEPRQVVRDLGGASGRGCPAGAP